MVNWIFSMKQYILQNSVFYVLALLIALGLKYHYSQAGSDDLDWILRPTAGVVEQMSGIHFEKEVHTGYINSEHRIIIAPSCAGVNFLIIAFCMAVFSYIHCFKRVRGKVIWLCGSIVSAYLLTLTVNALRIIAAMYLYQADIYSGWFTQERLHRLEGILVYFFFLCVYYLTLQRVVYLRVPLSWWEGLPVCVQRTGRGEGEQEITKFPEKHKRLRFIHTGLIPVFWYCVIMLLVPLLNAAYYGNVPRFIEHCSFVFIGCLAVFLLVFLSQVCWNCLMCKK